MVRHGCDRRQLILVSDQDDFFHFRHNAQNTVFHNLRGFVNYQLVKTDQPQHIRQPASTTGYGCHPYPVVAQDCMNLPVVLSAYYIAQQFFIHFLRITSAYVRYISFFQASADFIDSPVGEAQDQDPVVVELILASDILLQQTRGLSRARRPLDNMVFAGSTQTINRGIQVFIRLF